jgi:hypothetical protein
MKTPPTIVIRLHTLSPPVYKVERVNRDLIDESCLRIGELLNDSELDDVMTIFGEFDVEVIYPK